MNIDASTEDMVLIGEVLVKLPTAGEFFNVFEYILKDTDKIKACEEEVSSTQWLTIDAIKKSMENKTLLWYERPEQVISALY